MACGATTLDDTALVYSDGSTTEIFIPITAVLETGDYAEGRITVDYEVPLGDLVFRRAFRLSNDLDSWGAASEFGTDGSITDQSDNPNYQGDFVTIAGTQRYIQFGVLAENSTSSNFNKGAVRLIIDLRC